MAEILGAVMEGVLHAIKSDEKAGGWKLTADISELQSDGVAKCVPWLKKRVQIAIVPLPDEGPF